MKRLLVMLFSIIQANIAFSLHIDSATVTGSLKWKYTSIREFPSHVKIIAGNGTTKNIKIKVDSLGRYTVKLVIGSYTIAPLTNLNYLDNRPIRINDQSSKISVEVKATGNIDAPILLLDTLVAPDLIPEKGVMFDFNAKKARLLDEFMKLQMHYFDIPGTSLALIKNGKLLYYNTYGVRNNVSQVPIDKNTLFEAGSVTKPVFAFVVMRLVEKGLLDLDKPLYLYLPYKELEHDERYKLITARIVLSHQTGLANWPQKNAKGEFELKFTPGTSFGYSGEAYEYLKRVVEQVCGKDMESILKEELLTPLQWKKNVYFRSDSSRMSVQSNGHSNNEPVPIRFIKAPMMSFSMVTEARSFSTFMLALSKKRGLKPESYKEMFKVHSTKEPGVNWGLGFDIEQSAYGPIYRHGGSTSGGFICNFSYFPDIDMGFVCFTNSEIGEWLSIPLLTEYLVTGKEK